MKIYKQYLEYIEQGMSKVESAEKCAKDFGMSLAGVYDNIRAGRLAEVEVRQRIRDLIIYVDVRTQDDALIKDLYEKFL